jgi:hypothetical protein
VYLPVIRVHYVNQEACYVARRPNGMPLSVPVWMTHLSAAEIEIAAEPRLPLAALLELRRLTTTCLSLLASKPTEEGHDVATSGATTRVVRRGRSESCAATAGGRTRGSDAAAKENDGTRAYTLTVGDVPVDGC